MSTLRPRRVRCPHCDHGMAVDVYDSLSVVRMPAARDLVLGRTLHRFTCPVCRGVVAVTDPVLYTDFDRGLWVQCAPEEERPHLAEHEAAVRATFAEAFDPERTPPIVQHMRTTMRLRLVYGHEELREKVVAADHGLDDAVVELLKEQVLVSHPWLLRDGVRVLVLDAVSGDGALVLWLVRDAPSPGAPATDDRRAALCEVPRAAYDALLADRAALEADNPGLFAGPYVNLMRSRWEPRPEAGP